MKALLSKEFHLAMHPTVPMFWLLSAMILIPNYPYYVSFFYVGLGLFFVCLTGRENHDIEYALSLPIRKRDVVKARFIMAVVVECVQMLLSALCAVLRAHILPAPNLAGMDANVALFALSLPLLGLFNLVFFTNYYRAPTAVGRAFLIGSIAVFVYIALAETAAHALPLFRDRLDTPDPLFMVEKLIALMAGMVLFAAMTLYAYRVSARNFERLDV